MADPLTNMQDTAQLENEVRQHDSVDPVVQEALKTRKRSKKRAQPSKIAAACGEAMLKLSANPVRATLPKKSAWSLCKEALNVLNNSSYGASAWKLPNTTAAAPVAKTDSNNGQGTSKSTHVASSPYAKSGAAKYASLLGYLAKVSAEKADIDKLVAELFAARQTIHALHLQSKDYAEHVALDEFYTDILDLIDEFVEVYQGQYGLVDQAKSITVETDTKPIPYLEKLCETIRKTREELGEYDTHLQNILDEMLSTSYRVKYKLTYLGKDSKTASVKQGKAESKAQQRFMGMVHAVQKGEMSAPSSHVAEVAKEMKPSDVTDYAETKRKGLPEHSEKEAKLAALAYPALVGIKFAFDPQSMGATAAKPQAAGGMPSMGGGLGKTNANLGGTLGNMGGAAANMGVAKLPGVPGAPGLARSTANAPSMGGIGNIGRDMRGMQLPQSNMMR